MFVEEKKSIVKALKDIRKCIKVNNWRFALNNAKFVVDILEGIIEIDKKNKRIDEFIDNKQDVKVTIKKAEPKVVVDEDNVV